MIKKMFFPLVYMSFMFLFISAGVVSAGTTLPRIGVTLHPYYSFVAAIVGNTAEVVPLIGEGFNPHNYRPQPEDIKRSMTLDALVVNGIGHDEFAFEIVEAADMKGTLPIIFANKDVSLIPVGGHLDGKKIVNPHTFVSVTASVRQIYTIAQGLSELFPEHADLYRRNARRYAARLRRMKAEYMERLAMLPSMDFRCATIHGGYDYLFQDFGLQVTAVIEPGHGLKPTASQLARTIDEIKRLGVDVIFTEMAFPDKYVDTIHEETGIRIRHLSHLTSGEYSKDGFEKGLRANLEALTSALIEAQSSKQGG
ncbi:metal ABC transporter solute-binding protein, Zn/Mn family [Pseudodesulfovibrio piezophilus]|uniref:Periplasmic solute binding protein n=1 Tax=Pseudodesulfovibrio piezophilus (strain DSM 21447 / JCM 15486 / C1TLV30) TaxID=1322246 RepID=M1WSG2_PSEP2|nr:zinc ABC transporter substrate-binding protein [Pseudodesulfovibrio piezophilus]CCH50174.1 Periplasmic solute binding protein [Pseudodesulfovibrio piezophilus C1TLV30]